MAEDVTKSVLRVRPEAHVPSRRLVPSPRHAPSPRHGRRVRLLLAAADGMEGEAVAAAGKVNLV